MDLIYVEDRDKDDWLQMPSEALIEELRIIDAKLRLLGIPLPYRLYGSSVIYGRHFMTTDISESIHRIVIPKIKNGAIEIPDFAFAAFINAKSVSIPANIKKFGSFVFRGCSELTEATILTTAIPDGTFEDCISLENVEFAENLEEIGRYAFKNCPKLKTVKIPAKTEISRSSFDEGVNIIRLP